MKIDRLMGILTILLQKDQVTAPWLAEKFEVTRRTINRDIESLCNAGIPITTTQGIYGGISIMDGCRLDKTLLTLSDIQSILAGLQGLASVSEPNQYMYLMEKISDGKFSDYSSDQHLLIDLGSWTENGLLEKIALIHNAIETHRKICFRYFAPKGETMRCIEPYYLIFKWAGWYVYGWCEWRQDYRMFKLDRMLDFQISQNFKKRTAAHPDFIIEHFYPDDYHAKALIKPEYKWRLIEESGIDSFSERPDGMLLFQGRFGSETDIITWILSFFGGAELLEPKSLRKKLASFGKELSAKYGDE